MRPRKFSGENVARCSCPSSPSTRFNEAPQIQRGKHHVRDDMHGPDIASMRPRKFSGENASGLVL